MHDGDHALVTTLLDVIATNIDLLEKARPELEFGKIDFVISGGENIYPAEIERILRDQPGVAELCVVGRADPKWGAVPVALVVPGDPAPDRDALLAACDGKLARFKCPRDVVFVPSLPRNAMGKIVPAQVRAMAEKLLPN